MSVLPKRKSLSEYRKHFFGTSNKQITMQVFEFNFYDENYEFLGTKKIRAKSENDAKLQADYIVFVKRKKVKYCEMVGSIIAQAYNKNYGTQRSPFGIFG